MIDPCSLYKKHFCKKKKKLTWYEGNYSSWLSFKYNAGATSLASGLKAFQYTSYVHVTNWHCVTFRGILWQKLKTFSLHMLLIQLSIENVNPNKSHLSHNNNNYKNINEQAEETENRH